MSRKTRLELTWIGKDERPRLEPRILIEDDELSFHAREKHSENDIYENMLIYGDNLLALKALEAEYEGRIKCIYIDPPFNTGSAFRYYDDNLEHSLWLTMMRERLEIMKKLLRSDGAIFVQLDDTEAAYCKVLMDEIFGRSNYVTTITVESSTASSFRTINMGPTQVSNFIFFYTKDKASFSYSPPYLGSAEVDLAHFSRFIENFDEDPAVWRFKSINEHILETLGYTTGSVNARWALAKKDRGEEVREHVIELANEFALENAYRVFETKTLQKPSRWLRDHIEASRSSDDVLALRREGMEPIYLYRGRQIYFLGKGLREVDGERAISTPVTNIWTDIPTNNLQREGGVDFPSGKKPEYLIRRILQMATNSPGDIVLDVFGGSGSTAAVAHKMRRRWIVAELKDHCVTHIAPRLREVINGKDNTGVTEIEQWSGGGGFRFYRLAPSLLERDRFGNWVISKEYNAPMLAEALCKHLGFIYAPSQDPVEYWRHGHSTETDFIYVTTQSLTYDALKKLSEEIGPKRTLLVCCKAFNAKEDSFPNLTVKKIPHSILAKCEWGRDDYSLRIANLPQATVYEEAAEAADNVGEPKASKPEAALPLFDRMGGK